MQILLNSLKLICSENLLDEKILIVASHSDGNQILQALALEGCGYVNLRAVTLYDLAFEVCSNYLYVNNLRSAEDIALLRFMICNLKKLIVDIEFGYFNKIEVNPQISSSMLSSIMEIRKAGLSSDVLQEKDFVDVAKGCDIKKLLSCYEDTLKDNSLVDEADIYKIACDLLENGYIVDVDKHIDDVDKHIVDADLHIDNADKLYYCAPDMELDFLEKRFLGCITKCQSLELPTNRTIKVDNDFELFQAYGVYNEVHEVIKRIKISKLRLDDVAVFYTETNTYSQLFYDAGKKYGIPITFGDGIDIRNTTCGRLLLSLLNWIKNGYLAKDLYSIFIDGDFSISNKDNISIGTLSRLFIKIKIGWNRNRYIPVIDREISEVTDKFVNATVDLKDKYEIKLLSLKALKSIFEDILGCIPEANSLGEMDYNALALGLSKTVEKYTKIKCQLDVEARSSIIETLKSSVLLNEDIMNITDSVQLVEALIGGIRVFVSSPKAGCVHIVNYGSGLYVNRKANFLVGMDSSKFPSSGLEDPVLLDVEREKISKELKLKRQSIKKNKAKMNNLISALLCRVTLGYSSFDTFEHRVNYPAFIMLRIFRLISDDESLDYSSLIRSFNEQANFINQKPEESLEEGEWWLSSAMKSDSVLELDSIKENYYCLYNGLNAILQRESSEFTGFDGKLSISFDEIDPRNNNTRVLSSSQLETLGKCPFKYFLKYVLGMYLPEELEFDSSKWLDPATRGTLLHSAFEAFYKSIKKTKEAPSLERHENLIYEIAEGLINYYKDAIPIPNEIVFKDEKKEILDICRVFLVSEEFELKNAEPVYFELSFGKKDLNDDIGEIDAVKIETSSGDSIYLKGVIDRVDKLSPEKYRIIDYKTGSSFGYDNKDVFKGGRQLQHALYSCSLEQILKNKNICVNPSVLSAEYVFPTVKGNGQRFVRLQNSKSEFFHILEKLFDNLKYGTMHMTNDIEDCKFCDYTFVCERANYSDSITEKILNRFNFINSKGGETSA